MKIKQEKISITLYKVLRTGIGPGIVIDYYLKIN